MSRDRTPKAIRPHPPEPQVVCETLTEFTRAGRRWAAGLEILLSRQDAEDLERAGLVRRRGEV